MQRIEVDDEVYRALENRVRSFGETPNSVLRREFGIDTAPTPPNFGGPPRAAKKGRRGKAPKASLHYLVLTGSLADGQLLFMHDYQGNRIDGVKAKVRGKNLEYEGGIYSMSALTREHMKRQGYESDYYRGPQFWYTAEGKSVKDLWDEYLKSTAK